MRPIDADAFSEQYGNYYAEQGPAEGFIGTVGELIAKQPTIEPEVRGRWISCEDELPEPYETVIVAVYGSDMIMPLDGETVHDAIERTRKQGYVTTGSLDDEGFWDGCDGFPMMIAPSFWMPFPDLPEQPEKEDTE